MNKKLSFVKANIMMLFVFVGLTVNAATFTVSNLTNAGAGSLRQAITDANSAGAGGHTINFSVSGVIALSSNLPIISNNNITIDGVGQTITVSANGGDISRYVFRGNAGADFLTVRNLDIKNTGLEAFRFDGSPTDVTIENIRWYNEFGNFYNQGIYFVGNALNLTVRNVIAEDHQNYNAVIEITGAATNLMVDNLTFDNSLSYHYSTEVIRIGAAATNCTFQNCNWNLDNGLSTNDGDYGIYFYGAVTDCTIKNVNILNCEYIPLYFRLAVDGLNISNLTTTNGDGGGGAYGIYFNYPVSNLNMDTVVIDLDHTNSTNDGDYGIYFRFDAINVNIDSLEIHDGEIYNMYIGRAATNFTMQRARLDNFNGYTAHQSLRFQGNTNNINLTDVIIDGDVTGTTNDGDYGLLFITANNVDVTLTNVDVNEFDVDGFYMFEIDNLTMDACDATNNYDGLEYYGGYDRSNNIIKNCSFTGSTRAGFLINTANATNQFDIDSCTFSDNQYGVWLYSSGGVKDIQFRDNIFSNNTISGLRNDQADGVLYSRNEMWNNPIGIDNVANNGNNDLENADGDIPVLLSSVNVGSGNYELTFTLPSFCNTSDCDVEIFTNLENDVFLNGRAYIAVFEDLGTGSNTVTVNSNGNTKGFWTATLKAATINNSVSEFSDPLTIQPQFPAGVGDGIALWMSADVDVTEIGGNDITEWKDRAGINTPIYYNSDPDLLDDVADLINFNPTVDFDGNDYLRWDGNAFQTGFTAGEIFTVLQEEGISISGGNGHPFDFGGGNSSLYTWTNQYVYEDFGSVDRKVWRPNSGALSLSEGTANGATLSGPLVNTLDYQIYNIFSEPNNWQSSFNGITAVTDVTNTVNFSGTPHLGARSGSVWHGRLPEIVLYNRVLDLDERQRVNSYLAIKYGLTLGHNYYASDWNGTTGTTLWTIGGGYDHDIAGVGRDDIGSLFQNQSKSINDDAIVTIYNEDQSAGFPISNALNIDTPVADKSFILWGNNDSIADFGIPYTPNTFTLPPSQFFFHMERIWRVAETGTIGNVTVRIPLNTRAEYMLVHNSDDFSTGTPTEIELLNDGNGNLYAVLNLLDGQYFTFGALRSAPGCVPAGLALWLKPDYFTAGNLVNGTGWADASGNDNDFTTVVSDPSVIVGALNFNNSIDFDNGDYLTQPSISSTFTEGEVFSVLNANAFSNDGHGFAFGGNSNSHYSYGNGAVYEPFGNNDRPGWNPISGAIVDGSGYTTNVSQTFDMREWNIYNVRSDASLWEAGFNGFTQMTKGASTVDFGGATNFIGRGNVNNWIGQESEVILYERVLSTNERERVNTYLALKYGETLHHDYLLGDGTILWDSSAMAAYHNDIAGIVRDRCQGLHQRQSTSQNEGTVLSIYIGDHLTGLPTNNFSNSTNIDTDKSAMLWGNNGLSSGFGVAHTLASVTEDCFFRMNRIWQIQETGTVNTVTVQAPTNAIFMIVHSNDAFGVGTIEVPLTNGRATYDFSDGDFFTFGGRITAPGGVASGIGAWWRGDIGASASAWNDYSDNNHDAVNVGTVTPDLDAANYNPAMRFNSSYYQYNGNEIFDNALGENYDNMYIFAVGEPRSGQHLSIWSERANNAQDAKLFKNNDNNLYFDAPFGYRLNSGLLTSDNGVNNIPNLFAGHKTTTSFTNFIQGDTAGTITSTYASYFSTGAINYIGARPGAASTGNSALSEVIVYQDASSLTPTQVQQINSYLALKYGITLGQSIPTDYIASDGTTLMWDATSGLGYNHDIAGIGRDDCAVLLQKQSKSVNQEALVAIGLGTIETENALNTDSFLLNKDFLVWGNDKTGTAIITTEVPPAFTGCVARLAQEWMVQENNSVSNLAMQFGGNTFTVPNGVSNFSIFIDTDGNADFTNGSPTIIAADSVDGNGIAHFSNLDLNDNDKFTFGWNMKAPGGVLATSQVNGVHYKYYQDVEYSVRTVESNLTGAGYIANISNPDDIMNNEDADFTLELTTDLEITTAGNYSFRFPSVDDYISLWIDGVMYLNDDQNSAAIATPTSSPITLSSGKHRLIVRWSDIGGANTLNLQYNGPDNGNIWTAIPDDVLFVDPSMALWLKADGEVENTGDGTTATIWKDQSGLGNNVTTAEGTPTFYNTTSNQLLNFNPSIDFQDDAMNGADNLNGFAFDKQGRTVFAVVNPSTNSGQNYIFSQGRDAVTSAHYGMQNFNSNLYQIGWGNDVIANGVFTVGQSTLATIKQQNFNINGVNNGQVFDNGLLVADENRNLRTQFNDAEDLVIGDIVDGTARFNGNIAEVIYYPWDLTTQEQEQVESYLGMKYAITQAHDYFASDGTLLWDSSAIGVYHNNIAAIARDDCSGLNQKQSKSIGDDEIVSIYNGNQSSGFPTTNVGNATAIAADESFMLWGSTDTTTAYTELYTPNSFTPPIGTNFYHMERIWTVREVGGTIGTVTVSVPSNTRAEYLLVSTNDDFSVGTPKEIEMIDDGNGNLYAILDLEDGDYFTFGFLQRAPGCVGAGLQLWLLPDNLPAGALTDGTGWPDNSLLLNDFTSVNASPTLVANDLNFNNYVEFNPGDYLSKPSISSGFSAGEVFGLLQTNSLTTQQGHAYDFGGGPPETHYTWNDGAVYDYFGTDDRLGLNPTTTTAVDGKPGISINSESFNLLEWNIHNVRADAGVWGVGYNGYTKASTNTNTVSFAGATNYLGFNGTNNWNGNNAETILYNRVLTDTERRQVNSYIAIKYGITLHHDYLSGDGVIVWDSSALASYHNDIAGIGREDCGGLHQKQSKSINNSGIITIGIQTIAVSNAANASEILEDTDYLIWGHDNAGFSVQNTDMPALGFSCGVRIAQEWKVQERGDINDVSLQFGGAAYSIPVAASNVNLFIDTDGDGDFTSGSPSVIEPDSVSNGIAYFSTIDLNHNDVFTFGWSQAAPGGVIANLEFWLDPNTIPIGNAINGTGWEEVSGNNNHFTSVNSDPENIEGAKNFNNAFYFDGNDLLTKPTFTSGFTAGEVFTATSTTSNAGNPYFFGGQNNDHYRVDDIYVTFGTTDRMAWRSSTGAILDGKPGLIINHPPIFDPEVWGLFNVYSEAGNMGASHDGFLKASTSTNNVSFANANNRIGYGNFDYYTGDIGDVILYNRVLTTNERERVNTYLSLKYGTTLHHDYVSSLGTILWDSSALATFQNDVAGIGADSCSGLFQKQSKSENSDAIVTMYNGDHVGFLPPLNTDNPDEFTVNNSFMLWGNNNLDTTYTGSYPSNTYVEIMERVWHLEETGTVGTVTLVVSNTEAEVLIIDTDGDFTDGNSIEIIFDGGEIAYDFADGDYFTFGKLICKEVATITCPASTNVDLTSYITGYAAGGTWSDESSSGVDISDPTDVDFSGAALGTYAYKYLGVNGSCDIVNLERLAVVPAPIVDDILICEGGVTELSIPAPQDRIDTLYQQGFNANQGYIIRSRCSGSNSSSCYTNDLFKFTNVGLELDPGTDFSAWYSWWYSWVHQNTNLRFGRMRDQEVSLTTDSSFTLLPGETASFSGQSARWWGVMEPDDYVQFWYVIDGVETMFANRTGTLSTSLQTSVANYTNSTASPQQIAMSVKVKNSWNEGHYVDNFMITKILAPPSYNFYSDAGLTNNVASGLSYDPLTTPGTIDTIYVTRTENGCESLADTVTVEVSPNSVTPMSGEEAFYCTGGSPIDLTAHISNYQGGGTWTDEDGSGVDLSDPTSVDVSSLADDSYNFRYELLGTAPCSGEQAVVTINIGLQPEPPAIDDITTCQGGSTIIAVPAPAEEEELLYEQAFNGNNGGYILLSRCTDTAATSCRIENLTAMDNRGLTFEDSTDFSTWTTWASHVYDVNQMHFAHLMDEQIVFSTDSFTLLDGEVANLSGDSRRYYGTMEASDYVKFFYVVNGVETEFDSREGNIATAYSTSLGFYENTTGAPVNIQLRFKVKNSYNEGHMIDNLKITKTLNKPAYNFYSDAALTSLEASGYSYDPATTEGTSDTIYVTTLLNGCMSLADTVIVIVDTNDVVPMDGSELFYCSGTATDLTAMITPFQSGGVFTDIDSSGVDLTDSSTVDFSAVPDGSYTFSYLVPGSCSDEEALITVHIGIIGGDPFVVQDGLVSTSLTECEDGDWIYFVDPNDDSRRIAAIKKNGNTIDPSAFDVTVDVDALAVDLERASGTGAAGEAVSLMRRFVQINCPTCDTLSPAVDVRLYWNPSEQTTAGTAMDNLMTTNGITGTKVWEWFKVSHDANDIPANLTEAGITDNSGTALTWAAPDDSGVELNGVDYAQFNNITTFSTFGAGWHVNQVDATILPVELLYLDASAVDNEYIKLDWATATEINNDGFEVQRSVNGIDFQNIAWIEGSGNSAAVVTYRLDDHEVSTNTYYYRLKQVDFDGAFTYSAIVSAYIKSDNGNLFDVRLQPNPSQGFGKVVINASTAQIVQISIYNNLGKKVLDEKIQLEIGSNELNLSSYEYAAGIYNVVIRRSNEKPVAIKWMISTE